MLLAKILCAAFLSLHRTEAANRIECGAVCGGVDAAHKCLLDYAGRIAKDTHMKKPALLQIGAHLAFANANDPFRNLTFSTIEHTVLVEPQPHIAAKLRALVASHSTPDHRIEVIDKAVSTMDGSVTFYSFNSTIDPHTGCFPGEKCSSGHWMTTQLASMSKKHIMKHAKWVGNLENKIVELQVPSTRVASLLKEANIDPAKELLILSVDAEGYDSKIVGQVDFDEVHPWLVVFEHQHLGAMEMLAVEDRLNRFGYRCLRDVENHWCIGGRRGMKNGPDWTKEKGWCGCEAKVGCIK